jgi:hypothetical protein
MLSLAPPPLEGRYSSIFDALTALNGFAATEGYAKVKRSYSYKGLVKRVDLKCDKSCASRPYISVVSEKKQRIKSSRLTDRPFFMELLPENTQ